MGQQSSEPISTTWITICLLEVGQVINLRGSLEAKCLSGGPLDMSAGELKQLLNSDPSQ